LGYRLCRSLSDEKKISDVADEEQRKELMFDDSFKRSASYFTVLQMLRIFSDTIHESTTDLEAMKVEWLKGDFPGSPPRSESSDFGKEVKRILSSNWDTVTSHQKRIARELIDRIERKTEEAKSLRDGVGFTAPFAISITNLLV